MQRRDFIRSAVRTAGATAIPLASAALAQSTEFFSRVNEQIDKSIDKSAEIFQGQVKQLTSAIGRLEQRVDILELKYRMVMSLLVISLIIDGGTSWLLFNAPVIV